MKLEKHWTGNLVPLFAATIVPGSVVEYLRLSGTSWGTVLAMWAHPGPGDFQGALVLWSRWD